MVLGGLDKISAKEVDFSPMEARIGAIEDKQKIIMYLLVAIIVIQLLKK
jgi:hypothetical protein